MRHPGACRVGEDALGPLGIEGVAGRADELEPDRGVLLAYAPCRLDVDVAALAA
jgi:hypothetical protein